MEEEKLRAIKRNLMGALEEDFEDNLDDIDESDLDEFLMNTDEQVKTSEEEKKEEEKEGDEENEISDAEEDCDAKNDESREEEKETGDIENKEEETKGEKDEEEDEIDEELEEKDTNEQNESSKWTSKGRSITSPQVFLQSTKKQFSKKCLFLIVHHVSFPLSFL